MKMKYPIGQQVMILNTQKVNTIVAVDSEAGWYRLSNSQNHYREEQLAAYPEEVFYTLAIYDNIEDEDLLNTLVFRDKLKASMYMEDLFTGFDDDTAKWVKDFESDKYFVIYDEKNSNKQYLCVLQAVKIIY